MKYTLTRIDPDAPVERYPQEQRQTVEDPWLKRPHAAS